MATSLSDTINAVRCGRFAASKPALEAAVGDASLTPSQKKVVLLALAECYQKQCLDNHRLALQALPLCRQDNDLFGMALCQYYVAIFAPDAGHSLSEVAKTCHMAVTQHTHDGTFEFGRLLLVGAHCLFAHGDTRLACDAYQKAKEACQNNTDVIGQTDAMVWMVRAQCHHYLSACLSVVAQKRVHPLLRPSGYIWEPSDFVSLAIFPKYAGGVSSGSLARSMASYTDQGLDAAINQAAEAGDHYTLGHALQTAAWLAATNGTISDAVGFARKSADAFQHLTNQRLASEMYHAAAGALRENLGEFDDAIACSQKAAECAEGAVPYEPFDSGQRYAVLGHSLFDADRTTDAVAAYEKAIACFQGIPNAWKVAASPEFNLGKCLMELGRHQEAIVHLQTAEGYYRRLGQHDMVRRARQLAGQQRDWVPAFIRRFFGKRREG